MFRADADADEARRNAAQHREMFQQLQRPGWRDPFIRSENSANQSILNEYLYGLCEPSRQFAAALNPFQVGSGYVIPSKRRCEKIGGGNGVLNSQIDSDTPDGRHRMRRI